MPSRPRPLPLRSWPETAAPPDTGISAPGTSSDKAPGRAAALITAIVVWAAAAERIGALTLHRLAARPAVVWPLLAVSWLGDGKLWYAVLLALPFLDGWRGVRWGLVAVAVGGVNLALCCAMKHRTARLRPFRSCPGIRACGPTLDEFSFPSGHTMHAVAFGMLLSHPYPAAAPWLLGFGVLVALSRVVLGLHYPSDVAAGAVIGWASAIAALLIAV